MTMMRWARAAAVTACAVLIVPAVSAAQPRLTVKAGINGTSVGAVTDYYDWLLCCDPLQPSATVDTSAALGLTGGLALDVPVRGAFGVQAELLFSRRRHRVDFEPFEPLQATFRRDSVELAALARWRWELTPGSQVHIAAGPAVGVRSGADVEPSDADVRRGGPEGDVRYIQLLPYGSPELLRRTQASIAAAAGWTRGPLVIEVRFTQGIQSIFKDGEDLVSAFVAAGGHEPTVRSLLPDFEPFFESARNRDVALLVGFRF